MKALFPCSLVALAALVSGCSADPEALQSLQDAVNQVNLAAANDVLVPQVRSDEVEFTPPFPDRIDPFTFPAGAAAVTQQTGTSITSAAQITVLGFAEVDQPRVFLRTRETTRSLVVGDTMDGVEVIAINPPTVDLRMGSLQWRASMFETNSQ